MSSLGGEWEGNVLSEVFMPQELQYEKGLWVRDEVPSIQALLPENNRLPIHDFSEFRFSYLGQLSFSSQDCQLFLIYQLIFLVCPIFCQLMRPNYFHWLIVFYKSEMDFLFATVHVNGFSHTYKMSFPFAIYFSMYIMLYRSDFPIGYYKYSDTEIYWFLGLHYWSDLCHWNPMVQNLPSLSPLTHFFSLHFALLCLPSFLTYSLIYFSS